MAYHYNHQLSQRNARLLSQLQSSVTACESYPSDYWYSDNLADRMFAKKICATCPVINLCLEYAIAAKEQGIWGGMTRQQRDLLQYSSAAG